MNKQINIGLIATFALVSCVNNMPVNDNITNVSVGGDGKTKVTTSQSQAPTDNTQTNEPDKVPLVPNIQAPQPKPSQVPSSNVPDPPAETPSLPPVTASTPFATPIPQETSGPTEGPDSFPSIPPLPEIDNGGTLDVGVVFEAVEEDVFSTLATKDDIKVLKLTLSGDSVNQANGGPIVSTLAIDKAKTTIKNIPPGNVKIDLEALDNQGVIIGHTSVTTEIFKNEISVVSLTLQLVDTYIEEVTNEPVGHLAIGIAVKNGNTIVRRDTVIPKGGYFLFENDNVNIPQTNCEANTNGTTPDFTTLPVPPPSPPDSLPALPNIPALPGPTPTPSPTPAPQSNDPFGGLALPQIDFGAIFNQIQGSSIEADIWESIPALPNVSPQTTCQDLTGSSFESRNTLLTHFFFKASAIQLKQGTTVDLNNILILRYSDNSNHSQGITWSSNNPTIAQVSSNGVLKALTSGQVILTATDNATKIKTSTKLTVHNSLSSTTTSTNFIAPSAQLQLSAQTVKAGDILKLNALNPSGNIYHFYWQISGNLMNSQTFKPNINMKMPHVGKYAAYLHLIGTDGKVYSAPNNPQIITVTAK